ncbi:MAG: TetR/AcrR family transcriptional regulator [Pseudomonadota bacterium]
MTRQAFKNRREEILELSKPLFAASGYDGVSMRDIAKAVGVTPAALYNHFSDKEQLYLDVVGYAVRENMGPVNALLEEEGDPWVRLEKFVDRLTRLLAKEKDLRRLMQWVLLDADEQRLRKLTECVFLDLFNVLQDFADELAPGHAPGLLVVSMVGLVIYPFETQPVRRFLPVNQRRIDDPKVLTRHIVGLLRAGIGGIEQA